MVHWEYLSSKVRNHHFDHSNNAFTCIGSHHISLSLTTAFENGTMGIIDILADLTAAGSITIIGGGDSVAATELSGRAGDMSHISTGGGASLELLEGKVLPGVAALNEK